MITHTIKAAPVSEPTATAAPSLGIPVAAKPNVSPPIRLACVEVCNFRRLACTRLDFDEETTVLVGANNSGKTSLLTVLRNFLGDAPGFRPYDLSLSQWANLRELSKAWEDLAEDPTTDTKEAADQWEKQLQTLLACMPFADLWFDAKEGAYSYVAPFITSLKWEGGAVGVRVRLEPVSNADELRKLAWTYREARFPVKGLPQEGHAWPADIIDYWLRHPADLRRIAAYRLDPQKGPLVAAAATSPQSVPPDSTAVDLSHMRKLIRVDFVAAQRGLGSEEDEARSESPSSRPGMFSSQLLKFARQHLNVSTSAPGQGEALVTAIAKAQADLDELIYKALKPAMEDVEVLGYPGLHDPQQFHFRTRIQTADLLAHSTAVQYRVDKTAVDESLPEHSIGLGYQNLQSLSFMLVSFRAARLNPSQGAPAAVHLVVVEEPEAHLHVQVQRNFSSNALGLIRPKEAIHANLRSQLLISTHSSHLAHGDCFTRLRYVKRLPGTAAGGKPSTEVVNLGDAFGNDVETRTFAERYFQVQHTDLLFADAAVFVEGTAERMLVPLFIERDFPKLAKKYVSFVDIGGSHAHRLRPLIERLGIPTAVITDLDPVIPAKSASGKTVRSAVHIAGQADLECGNDTLTSWHPKLANFNGYGTPAAAELEWTSPAGVKVRFAWQLPVATASNQWPSSFEDALVLSNIAWFKKLDEEVDEKGEKRRHRGALGKVVDLVLDHPDHVKLLEALHKLMHGSFGKGDFAATIFERLNAGAALDCPEYIKDALAWLGTELKVTAGETP